MCLLFNEQSHRDAGHCRMYDVLRTLTELRRRSYRIFNIWMVSILTVRVCVRVCVCVRTPIISKYAKL